jgi:hypothetical protein
MVVSLKLKCRLLTNILYPLYSNDPVLLTKYYSGEQIEKNEMGGAYSTYGGRGEVHAGFWCGNLRERDCLEDPSLDGRIILKWILRKWDGGRMDWIDLAEHWDRWRVLANAVMNLRVP